MSEYRDVNDKVLSAGDMIDLHQTVNGCNLFLVMSTEPLDIRYGYDLDRKYEYDQADLLAPDKISGTIEWEIIT